MYKIISTDELKSFAVFSKPSENVSFFIWVDYCETVPPRSHTDPVSKAKAPSSNASMALITVSGLLKTQQRQHFYAHGELVLKTKNKPPHKLIQQETKRRGKQLRLRGGNHHRSDTNKVQTRKIRLEICVKT